MCSHRPLYVPNYARWEVSLQLLAYTCNTWAARGVGVVHHQKYLLPVESRGCNKTFNFLINHSLIHIEVALGKWEIHLPSLPLL